MTVSPTGCTRRCWRRSTWWRWTGWGAGRGGLSGLFDIKEARGVRRPAPWSHARTQTSQHTHTHRHKARTHKAHIHAQAQHRHKAQSAQAQHTHAAQSAQTWQSTVAVPVQRSSPRLHEPSRWRDLSFCWHSLIVSIETPAKGRGGCSRMAVSPTVARAVRAARGAEDRHVVSGALCEELVRLHRELAACTGQPPRPPEDSRRQRGGGCRAEGGGPEGALGLRASKRREREQHIGTVERAAHWDCVPLLLAVSPGATLAATSKLEPGSCTRNWLQGNARIVRPWAEYRSCSTGSSS